MFLPSSCTAKQSQPFLFFRFFYSVHFGEEELKEPTCLSIAQVLSVCGIFQVHRNHRNHPTALVTFIFFSFSSSLSIYFYRRLKEINKYNLCFSCHDTFVPCCIGSLGCRRNLGQEVTLGHMTRDTRLDSRRAGREIDCCIFNRSSTLVEVQTALGYNIFHL